MESNWRYNFYRYGLTNLWEVPQPTRLTRAYVKASLPGLNWIWLRETSNVPCFWFVPPVDTTTKQIVLINGPGSIAAVDPVVTTDFYRDQPLVLPWQGRIDPIN